MENDGVIRKVDEPTDWPWVNSMVIVETPQNSCELLETKKHDRYKKKTVSFTYD